MVSHSPSFSFNTLAVTHFDQLRLQNGALFTSIVSASVDPFYCVLRLVCGHLFRTKGFAFTTGEPRDAWRILVSSVWLAQQDETTLAVVVGIEHCIDQVIYVEFLQKMARWSQLEHTAHTFISILWVLYLDTY